jgi:pimeloyl-ACP methyl ester carboxylesterase
LPMRGMLVVLALLVLSGCVPMVDGLLGSDLAILGPQSPAVGDEVTYTLAGSAVPDLVEIRWDVNGRPQPSDGLTLRVRLDRPGIHTVAAEARGIDGDRIAFLQPVAVLPNRPAGTPDVVVFAFSGRCAFPCHPNDNRDGWGQAHRDALTLALAAEGADLRVEFRTYRAHVHDRTGYGRGFLSALDDLDGVQASLMNGFANPTRLVVMGHSHGTQFAHLLAYERPDVGFAASVLLDSVCQQWDVDHAAAFVVALRSPRGAPGAGEPYSVGCKVKPVSGRGYLDVGDAVPVTIERSLEVHSGGTEVLGEVGLVRDATLNSRGDGTRRGIELLSVPWEGHARVAEASSYAFLTAMAWLAEVLAQP